MTNLSNPDVAETVTEALKARIRSLEKTVDHNVKIMATLALELKNHEHNDEHIRRIEADLLYAADLSSVTLGR